MIRSLMALFISFAVQQGVVAQCQIGGPNPFVPVEILASAIGQKGPGGSSFAVGGSCPGESNAHVKFKLETNSAIDSGLIVSPSSGITPLVIEVGVDPRTVGNWFPVQINRTLRFTTIDQNPPVTASVRVRVTLTTPDPPIIQSVVNAASLAPVITPGSVVVIRGASIGPTMSHTLDVTGQYPTTLGNTTVSFNGILAPLLSSSPGVIKTVAPYALAGQTDAQVLVTHYPGSSVEQVSPSFSVQVAETSLGIFSRAQTGDFQNDIENCDANRCTPNSAENPAATGSIIVFYATGLARWAGPDVDGAVAILARLYPLVDLPTVTIGGRSARVLYAGTAPYQVWGVLQVNAVIPQGISAGPQPLVLTVRQSSNMSQDVAVFVK